MNAGRPHHPLSRRTVPTSTVPASTAPIIRKRSAPADFQEVNVPSTGQGASAHDWWRTAAIYEVYVRSFADGNGDGVGDLAGVRARLPYLAELGIDAIWFAP